MKLCILLGSPRKNGNTAALVTEFEQECGRLGIETETVWLYDKKILPCLGCMSCQDHAEGPGCVQEDDFAPLLNCMVNSDGVVFATPVYSWYCTVPMKSLIDRTVYAGNKNYGLARGVHLLEGKCVAGISTCGYPAEKGVDLWEQGLRRFCKHSRMNYMGMFCRRDMGRDIPFMNEERSSAVRDFAQALALAVKVDGYE